jgi:predicted nucleic acid-binding Zn ribbon protein
MCPIYTYSCEQDNEKKEELLSWSDVDAIKNGTKVIKCDKCGSIMKRSIDLANFVWNCSGSHNSEYSKYGRKK